jgi:hypothetical protein
MVSFLPDGAHTMAVDTRSDERVNDAYLVSICSLRFFRHFPSDDRRPVLCAARDTYCVGASSVMMSPRCLARFRFEGCVTHIKMMSGCCGWAIGSFGFRMLIR